MGDLEGVGEVGPNWTSTDVGSRRGSLDGLGVFSEHGSGLGETKGAMVGACWTWEIWGQESLMEGVLCTLGHAV